MTADNLWPWMDNDEWLTHAVRPQLRGTAYNYRIELMANQIQIFFGEVPDNLDDFIFASQVSQAEALKFFIERFRIGKGRRSGILWWNVRDGWPQISDAVVDYYGARKVAYHLIKRVQQDVCIMIDEPDSGYHSVVAVNDARRAVEIEYSILAGEDPLLESSTVIPANGKVDLGTVATSAVPALYRVIWHSNGDESQNHYLAGPRPFDVSSCREWYEGEGLLQTQATQYIDHD